MKSEGWRKYLPQDQGGERTETPQAQTFVAIPEKQWQEIIQLLEEVKLRLEPKDKWLTVEEACEELGISLSTWHAWRRRFHLDVSQIGRRVCVKLSTLEHLRESRMRKDGEWLRAPRGRGKKNEI